MTSGLISFSNLEVSEQISVFLKIKNTPIECMHDTGRMVNLIRSILTTYYEMPQLLDQGTVK